MQGFVNPVWEMGKPGLAGVRLPSPPWYQTCKEHGGIGLGSQKVAKFEFVHRHSWQKSTISVHLKRNGSNCVWKIMGVAHLTLQSIWTWALVILRQWTSNWKYSQILFQNVNLAAVTKGAPKHKTLFKHSRLKGQLLSQSLSNPLYLGSYQYHCIASA